MSDVYNDGNIAAWFVPSIANIAAPTIAELTAVGVLALHNRMTPDGLKINPSTDKINNSKMVSTFTTQRVGRRGYDASVKYEVGDQVADQAFDTTLVYKAQGFLVVRRGIAATVAPAASQKVEVYPVECGEPAITDPSPNSIQEKTVDMQVTADPRSASNPATVAAS